ncbi:MAG TPA: hypothetical protein VFB80_11300 [Pirellulaceae bacterium]|nr:hypothetical protein [Pirellulaceae bacterium]
MGTPAPVNPYASPAPAPPGRPPDFRDLAVEESRRLIAAASGLPLERQPFSLCVPVENPDLTLLRKVKTGLVLRLVFGLAGLAGGGILAAIEEKGGFPPQLPDALILGVAVCSSLGGMLLLVSSATFFRRLVRRALGERFDQAQATGSAFGSLIVGVEDWSTFRRMKLAPEDFACVFFDEAAACVRLEGARFRYFIRAADVVSLSEVAGASTVGTQIVYRIGRTTLGITLQYDSFLHELRRQTIGARHTPLWTPLTTTLRRQ